MKLDEYQYELRQLTESIGVQGDRYEFNIIGLAEEAGELMGKLKRALRGEGFDRVGYVVELGDVLGYLALAATAREISLNEIFALATDSFDASLMVAFDFPELIKVSSKLYTTVGKLLDDPMNYDRIRVRWLLSAIYSHLDTCAAICQSSLEEVMELNLAKLRDRLERNGTLLGTGDYR